MTKKYNIEFINEDNGQIFRTSGNLTDEERAVFQKILKKYQDDGYIKQPKIYEPTEVNHDFYGALGEVMDALSGMVADQDQSECQNCGCVWPDYFLNEVEDLSMRVGPGEIMPSGECPACGAVCHPVKEG
jgi:hypothetical protein